MVRRVSSPTLAPLAIAAVAAALGVLAGTAPRLALPIALGAAVCVIVVADLTLGAVAFTLASFADVSQLGSGSAISAVKAIGLLLVLSWLAALSLRGRLPARDIVAAHPGLVLCGILLIAWSALSSVWAQDSSSAFAGTGRYALDLVLFPVIYTGVRECAHVRWIAAAFVAGALVSAAYGGLVGLGGDAARLSGAVGDPNQTAAVLVASGLFALALSARFGAGSLPRLAAIAAATCSFIGLAATGSRGGLVALAVAVAVAIVLAGRWRGRATLAALLASGAIVTWLFAFAPAALHDRVLNTDTTGRSTIWTVAARVIEAHPIKGVGADNFRLVSAHYLNRPGATKRADFIIGVPKVAHSVYLETLADLGLVGLALFGGLIAISLSCAIRAARLLRQLGRHADEIVARGLVIAIAGMLAAGIFISDVWSKQLWLLLALGPAQLAAARAYAPRPRLR
jgi:O-antigen ligase